MKSIGFKWQSPDKPRPVWQSERVKCHPVSENKVAGSLATGFHVTDVNGKASAMYSIPKKK